MTDAEEGGDTAAREDTVTNSIEQDQNLLFYTAAVGGGSHERDRWFRFVPERRSRRDNAARELQIATVRSHAARVTHARRESNRTHSRRRTLTTATSDPETPQRNPDLTGAEQDLWRFRSNAARPDSTPQSALFHTFQLPRRRPSLIADSVQTHREAVGLESSFRVPEEPSPGLRVDPFRSINSAIDEQSAFILDWHQQIVIPRKEIAAYVFDITNHCATFRQQCSDDTFFHAGLATVRYMYEQIHNPGSEPSPEVFKHRGLALAALRERLISDPVVDDATIHPILWLCVLEANMGNWQAHRVHKRRLLHLIAARGGLQSLADHSSVKGCLMQFDTSWKILTGESVIQGPILPIREEPRSLDSLESLPRALQQLYVVSGWTQGELGILCRAYKLSKMSLSERVAFLHAVRNLPRRCNGYREASQFFEMTDDVSWELGTLLAMTVAVFCFTSFEPRATPHIFQASRGELSRRVSAYNPRSGLEEEALIWMWVIAINSWAIESTLQPSGEVLMVELQRRYPGASDVEYAIEVSKQFLWTSCLTTSVEKYWRIT